MLSLRVTSQKWTLFCVYYYSKLLMHIYINYIPLEAWVHCLQTVIVNWCWDNISTEIFKKKTDFFSALLIHHCGWNRSQEKHDIMDSLSHAVVLENSSCLNLLEIELLLQQRALTTRKISVSILSQNIGDQFYIYFCDNLLFTQRVENFICIKIMKS